MCSSLGLSRVLPPAPFAHLCSALTPHPVPKCRTVMISPYLQLLWKNLNFSSQALLPSGWPLCPLLFPPYPWPTSGAARLQSLYLVFLWWVARGQPAPARRAARLCARTTGSLNALKSCSVLGTVGPGPPQPGLSGQAFMESWPPALGTAGPCILPLPGVVEQRGQAGDVTTRGGGGTQGYWKYPAAITAVSATRLPSPASWLEVPETGAMEGTVVIPAAGEQLGRGGEGMGSSQGDAGPHASSLRLYSFISSWVAICRCLR